MLTLLQLSSATMVFFFMIKTKKYEDGKKKEYNGSMRSLKTMGFLIGVFVFCKAFCAFGDNLYLMLNYENGSSIYRVLTSDEFNNPVGYFSDADPAQSFFVDEYQNFRFCSAKKVRDYSPIAKRLYRQTFDGNADDSDKGLDLMKTHFDSRDKFSAEELYKGIFRPLGAPYSMGPGEIVASFSAPSILLPEKIFENRSFYRVPNGSWYQTWEKRGESYMICKDEVEFAEYECVENFWRGQQPGLAFSRKIGEFYHKRLKRSMVSGGLELLDIATSTSIILTENENWTSSQINMGGKIGWQNYTYIWSDRLSGKLFRDGKVIEDRPLIESLSSDKRFIVLAGLSSGKVGALVLGRDVINSWLGSNSKFDDLFVSCDLVDFFKPQFEEALFVSVYSKSDSCIYFFKLVLEVNDKVKAELVKQIYVQNEVSAIKFDKDGNLFYSCSTCVPSKVDEKALTSELVFEAVRFDENEKSSFLESPDEKLVLEPTEKILKSVTGRLILSQSFYEKIYKISPDRSTNNEVSLVYLNKKYYKREFYIQNTTSKVYQLSGQELFELAGQSGNKLLNVVDEVEGYPDQYITPIRTLLATSE